MGDDDKSLFVCTTVGATRYLDEWLEGVKLLNPSIIVIARDLSRSEPLNLSDQSVGYDSSKVTKF